jgi:hypothetical protein
VPKDYSSAQSLAQRLITDKGRTVTILKSDNTTESVPGEPWMGYDEADAEIADVPAVFVFEFGQELAEWTDKEFASLIPRDAKVCLIAKLDVPSEDLTTNHKLTDGSNVYSIETVREFSPGPVVIFYVLVLKQ